MGRPGYEIPKSYVAPVPVSCTVSRVQPGSSSSDVEQSPLSALDAKLEAFGRSVVERLATLEVVDEHPDLFPFGRSTDGACLEVSDRTDLMVTCFPGGGASYAPHVDNTDGDARESIDLGRCFTLMYYVNGTWRDEEGGALRLYVPKPVASRWGFDWGTVPVVELLPCEDALFVILLSGLRSKSAQGISI